MSNDCIGRFPDVVSCFLRGGKLADRSSRPQQRVGDAVAATAPPGGAELQLPAEAAASRSRRLRDRALPAVAARGATGADQRRATGGRRRLPGVVALERTRLSQHAAARRALLVRPQSGVDPAEDVHHADASLQRWAARIYARSVVILATVGRPDLRSVHSVPCYGRPPGSMLGP